MSYTLGETLLKIDHVSYEVNGFKILTDVNAEVRKISSDTGTHGQVVGFLGLSGSGKTTLFRIIAGLLNPTSGQVHLNNDKQVSAGEVGVVSQNYALFNHRTVYSNLLVAAQKKDPKTASERVMAFLNDFQMADKRGSYPAQLSGGQRQRVAILQQILCSEHFLLMDEPFSGLDIKMEDKTIGLIQKVAAMNELNTIIVVTHDITAACAAADHLWVLGGSSLDSSGNRTGSRIVKEYNLLDQGFCWHPELTNDPEFVGFVSDVKSYFRSA